MSRFTIEIEWRSVETHSDSAWGLTRCLYSYIAPPGNEVVYIGKAWGVTVRGRWTRSAKEGFWSDLERQRGIHQHAVIVGELSLPVRSRLSHELLCDVESLLINRVQPWGNIQCVGTRMSRPQIAVRCRGKWPLAQTVFRDS